MVQKHDLQLTNYHQFMDLHFLWIQMGTIINSSKKDINTDRHAQKQEPCQHWNLGQCPNSAGTCTYVHICTKCHANAHKSDMCK